MFLKCWKVAPEIYTSKKKNNKIEEGAFKNSFVKGFKFKIDYCGFISTLDFPNNLKHFLLREKNDSPQLKDFVLKNMWNPVMKTTGKK